jgi:molybdopterin converting factor small subunit
MEMKNKINIKIKMFMKFREYLPPDSSEGSATISLDEGSTLNDLVNILGIPVDEAGAAVINCFSYGFEDSIKLNDGDVISFFAPVFGG